MPKNFQPSSESLTAEERTRSLLQYLKKAVSVIEAHLDKGEDLPPWVINHVHSAARDSGMAVSYLQYKKRKEG